MTTSRVSVKGILRLNRADRAVSSPSIRTLIRCQLLSFIMERAAGLVFPAGLFQLGPATHNLNDICYRDQIVDEVLRD